MSVKKNFIVRQGIEVADNLIVAENGKVGIGTSSANYTLDVNGDISINGRLYLPTSSISVGSTVGIVSLTSTTSIVGINTTGIIVGDYVVGTYIQSNTIVTKIGIGSLNILPNHTNSSGIATTTFSFLRYKFSGESGQSLVSQGPGLPPIWKRGDASIATTAINVIGGIASVTQLSVSGISTLGIVTAGNIYSTGIITASSFVGNITGTATTATNLANAANITTGTISTDRLSGTYNISVTNAGYSTNSGTSTSVIGGIASITQLSVSGVSTFNIGIFSGSTSGDLVRITQSGTGAALRVEDSANPDATPFIIDNSGRVGINTIQPNYDLDIKGRTAFGGPIFVEGGQLTSRVGILSGTDRSIISGIDTSGIEISDFVSDVGGLINSGTLIVSVGVNSVGISPNHNRFGTAISSSINIIRAFYAGSTDEVLVSRGSTLPPTWSASSNSSIVSVSTITPYYPTFALDTGRQSIGIAKSSLVFISNPGNLGIGSTIPSERLDVNGNVKVSGSISVGTTASVGFLTASNIRVSGTATVGFLTATNVSVAETVTSNTVNALTYFGNAVNLSGIVTQITAGIGVSITSTQNPGKGVVTINSYFPIGKTIFVTQTGNDSNSGLTESDSKKTIKAAAAIAFPGDTIKVFPGVYVENNPIYLRKRVAVEGTELRNCIVTPKYPDRDLFYVNNSCHLTDLSFIGSGMTNGAAVVALQPLSGVATDRFFDATRLIRFNLDYIANEAVGFLTSTQYIGAGRTQVSSPVFVIPTGNPNDCKDDIKDIFKAVIHDITRGGNSKCVGAGKSYYSDSGALLHITGNDVNGYSIKQATIDTIRYAAGIARAVINNSTWGSVAVGSSIGVTAASYSNITGVTTITASSHGLVKDAAVRIVGLGFTCPSGPGIVTYPSGAFGYIFNVRSVLSPNQFEVVVGQSTLPHTYVSGGTIQKFTNYQNQYTQVKDLGIQTDSSTGFNNAINGCANVVSAIYSCVGVVTSIINNGPSILGVGFNTTFPANRGIGTTSVIGVTSAVYNNITGQTTILAPGLSVKPGSMVEVRDLIFECSSGGPIGTQRYPSGNYGYIFDVTSVNSNGSFVINTGISTIPHSYKGGGFVVNRAIGVTTASYNNITGITTITAPGVSVRVGDFVRLHDLQFSCTSGAGTTTLYPTGNLGYDFRVLSVVGSGTTFTVNTGVSTIPHTYVGGGFVFPPYSPGVGPITQGPYVRNCTNFISNSIGMKVDGFNAEPGDQDDIGVTGTMSVDSYTQYNQGGIGVSISNGAYSQLVSIFTICDDIGIYTESGGQCDITNSNCSFGNYGLYSKGVGGSNTKSIYRYTGIARTDAASEQSIIQVSGIGNLRPYDGQAIYFDELYYEVRGITVTNGGSGYTSPPVVTISSPTGPNGIRAEASANIDSSGKVTSVDVISTGSQYRLNAVPSITIAGPGSGTTATATLDLYPLYYTIESATLPSAGISTIVLNTNLNNIVGSGTTVYFTRLSLQIATSISLEWVGAGTNINTAKPALGGVAIQENEVVKSSGGQVVYTSTNQSGNFQIGDDIRINQLTGTISGRAFNQSILNTVTPLIIALGN